VSDTDAQLMREMFGIKNVSTVATGVDVDYFCPTAAAQPAFDIVFVGSMDWMPNHDGVRFFFEEILPRVRRAVPDCTVGIVGRTPPADLVESARRDGRITVTGTVPDVRPYLWGASLSIVPLRIGGGTRLKIYESMAAGTPVVSTTIGAEGLEVMDGQNILLADTPEDFAAACVQLLQKPDERARLAAAARELVTARFSWDAVADRFEQIISATAC
jgi:polysaccharide biosynthesis protein PslH